MKNLILCFTACSIAGILTAGDHQFPQRWIDGTDPAEPAYQVHAFDDDTWIVRQSLSRHFEGPFIYVLKGTDRALLLDTGATDGSWLREVIDELIGTDFPLTVAHTHAHGDHVAGDSAFQSRPATDIVGHSQASVAGYFDIHEWPMRSGVFDLGGRPLSIVPIPGHEPSSIAIYDMATASLFTGDTLYPGRLYVSDFVALRASVNRLLELLSEREVRWILGAHIEMTNRAGQDFGPMQPQHPNERRLQLEWRHLTALAAALESMSEGPEYRVFDDFIIYPVQ